MTRKSNPTLIGAFVVGATLLLALGVAIFGGAQFFAKKRVFVAYFDDRTQGLRVGSSVTMNGAQIGQVSKLVLLINPDTFESITAVQMDILPESWVVIKGGAVEEGGLEAAVTHEELINSGGLRAQLQSESLVTGQLLIDMTFQPNTKAVFRGGANTPYPEIPTISSNIEQIMHALQKVLIDLTKDFDGQEVSRRIQSIIRGLDELANSKELRDSLAGVSSIINQQETQQLSATLQSTLVEFRSAAANASTLIRNVDGDMKPVVERLAATLDEAQQALAAAKIQLRGESAEVYQLDETLREVGAAARSMREFLDYMERNPEALLQGKKP